MAAPTYKGQGKTKGLATWINIKDFQGKAFVVESTW